MKNRNHMHFVWNKSLSDFWSTVKSLTVATILRCSIFWMHETERKSEKDLPFVTSGRQVVHISRKLLNAYDIPSMNVVTLYFYIPSFLDPTLGLFHLFRFQFAYIKVPFLSSSFQEVGSIIGKKGEIVKRFRDEVRNLAMRQLKIGRFLLQCQTFFSNDIQKIPRGLHTHYSHIQ